MKKTTFQDILFDTKDAILNEEFEGFKEDYLCLHSLIRKYRPLSFLEVGTNMGTGTNIICNAIYQYHFEAKIYSLDLPTELAHISLQHPISEGKGDRVGEKCKLPFIQLRGDSIHFDFSKYPCEGYFVDGEHRYYNVNIEATRIMELPTTKIVIFHDADIPGVWNGIVDAHRVSKDFDLFRVTDTRMAYTLRK